MSHTKEAGLSPYLLFKLQLFRFYLNIVYSVTVSDNTNCMINFMLGTIQTIWISLRLTEHTPMHATFNKSTLANETNTKLTLSLIATAYSGQHQHLSST